MSKVPPRSKVYTVLPKEVREELDRRIIAHGFGNYSELSRWLQQQGYSITERSIYRHGRGLEEKLEAIKAATAAARTIAEASPDDEGAMSDTLIRLVQEKIFSVLIDLKVRPGKLDLIKLTKIITDLAKTSVSQKRWQLELRAKVAARVKGAEEKVSEVVKAGGLSDDAYQKIRAALLEIDV